MEMTSYASGTPCWVDLPTDDIQGACKFYGPLFGWEFDDQGPEAGHYHIAKKHGMAVAAISPKMDPQAPTAWSTFVAVDDIDVAVKAAADAGGTIVLPPMDVMRAGKLAVIQDPTGAYVSAWQADMMPGAALVNVPGALVWNELETRDTEKAKAFYNATFGWDTKSRQPGTLDYTSWLIGDAGVAGMIDMANMFPAEVPAHWLTYFGVDDTDAAMQKAQELGGHVVAGPTDIELGRFAILTDAQGAAFAVITLAE